MSKFDRYLLSQLTVLFGFFSLVLVSIYWVNRAVLLFDQLIGDGQSASVFLEITALALPNVIRLVLPVSAFAATVYVINRLTSESELVVVQAMGYSGFRLARPVFVFGLMVALLVALLNHFLVPASRAELSSKKAEIAENITSRLLTEGQFLHPATGITFYIREITADGELLDIFLSDARDPARRTTYTAERSLLVPDDEGPKLVMFDGMAQTLRYEGQQLSTTRFKDSVYDIAGLIISRGGGRRAIEELSTPELLSVAPELLTETRETPASFLYEAHARIAQPFLAVAGPLIGFAALILGGFSRFGVWRQVLLAVFLLIVLQLLDNAMADVARKGPTLWPAVYIPPIAGVLFAMGLLWISNYPGLFRRKETAA
ncbi:LPS export ABC transporter permease LptF [Actibacterium lipolyticum]|uniref:Putative permease YjgP/YjgQ family protein n=1 Tax=Actibacterium lipolyticum TaxID=1524263 RepID=A0A238JV21_9RHOB|nr:LPS export ABC transporter permease LptF [Actibacterium lipolyticum]SMX34509.1 putative permease YjgP/YjgQ family protein [Actibacterium lipolyticum]